MREKFRSVTDYKVRPGYGYFTDDTQLSIMMAESLIEGDELLVEKFRKKLARWRLVFPRLSGRATGRRSTSLLARRKSKPEDQLSGKQSGYARRTA